MLTPGDQLVIASHNEGKFRELSQLMRPYGVSILFARELKLLAPEENEKTFEGNASLKGLCAAKQSGLPALGDDSGLQIQILDGAPGVYSARWAGPDRNFSEAMEKVWQKIQDVQGWSPSKPPKASFVCVLSLAWPDGRTSLFKGQVNGNLVWPPRGSNGFGYDPMFVPEGKKCTFGELSPEEKNALSHRTRAFLKFRAVCLLPSSNP